MARVLVDCHTCACLIQVEDPTCPFCGAGQRRVGAPRWLAVSLVCGLGLTTIACDDNEDAAWLLRDLPGTSTGGTTTATTGTGTTGTGTGTTLDDTTMTPDASTYAGPDETDTIPPWSTSDTGTSSGSSGSTTVNTSADASTYAGPDETTSIPTTEPDPPTPNTTDTTDTTGGAPASSDATDSSGTSGQESGDEAGCGCASQTTPSAGLVGLVVLGATRRRRARPAR